MKHLTDATEIVEVLGGPERVARMTRAKNAKAVWNWHGYFRTFPPATYVVMQEALQQLGYSAPPSLWRMRGLKRKTKRAA